jgi:hypothetical protein
MAMTGLGLGDGSRYRMAWRFGAAVALTMGLTVSGQVADNDVFRQAVNYVFTGQVDPSDAPDIVDRKGCVVVVPDPKNNRFARYHLGRFKMDGASYDKRYSGARTFYDLDVRGDDIILEYLSSDKTKINQAFRSAQISLPGNIDQSQRALQIIAESCRSETPKAPF